MSHRQSYNLNLGTALLTALKDCGATEIFGIPGDFALPFFKIIEESEVLPLYLLSHEPGLGYAADAAARFNGKLGVVAVTYGAGAFNMVNAVAMAYAEKSPLVIISGAPGKSEAAGGLQLHHQTRSLESQLKVYEEITCDQAVIDNPAHADRDIARVLDNCLRYSKPVYIELPRDLVNLPCPTIIPPQRDPVDEEAVTTCALEIIERLRQGSSPVLLAGVEVKRFGLEAKVGELARKLGIPLATSFMGRGMFAEQKTPLIGTYFGVAGDATVAHAIENSDALLLLGTIYSDCNFGIAGQHVDMRKAIIASDREVRLGFHVYPNLPLSRLLDALLDLAHPIGDAMRWHEPNYPHDLAVDDEPVTPDDISSAINDLFHRHGPMPITSDVGVAHFTVMNVDTVPLAAPGYYAGMGFAVPAALGVQAASGNRPLALVGDGAFQMTGWELGNCQRYGWDPIILVLNNCCWEMLRTFQPETKYNFLSDWHFTEMAAPLGGVGIRVETRRELFEALEEAVQDRGRFRLIEIMLPPAVQPQTMTQFVAGVKKLSVLGKAS